MKKTGNTGFFHLNYSTLLLLLRLLLHVLYKNRSFGKLCAVILILRNCCIPQDFLPLKRHAPAFGLCAPLKSFFLVMVSFQFSFIKYSIIKTRNYNFIALILSRQGCAVLQQNSNVHL